MNLAYLGCCALAIRSGVKDLGATPSGLFEKEFGAWRILLNGRSEASRIVLGIEIPPFSAAVYYNGWLAGVLDPAGGVIAAGDAANEDSFIAAVESELGSSIEASFETKH